MATIGTRATMSRRDAAGDGAIADAWRGDALGSRAMGRGRLDLFRTDDHRSPVERARRLALQAASLARLPRPVAASGSARCAARRPSATRGASTSPAAPPSCASCSTRSPARRASPRSAPPPRGRRAASTLARPGREVHTWDVEAHPERERYLALLSPADRARVHLHDRPGGLGPADPPPVDAVFIDSSHELEETVATFRTWEPALAPGGVIAFHDYADDAYPGVTQAVRELGLQGEARGHLFVWRKPDADARAAGPLRSSRRARGHARRHRPSPPTPVADLRAADRARPSRRAAASGSSAGSGGDEPTKRVMYVNAHVLNQSREDPALREALEDADLVYCDGYGVRLAAKALSAEIPHRMTGADWIWDLAALCEQQDTLGVPARLRARRRRARPASACAARTRGCASSAPTTATSRSAPGHDERVIEDINARKPDILLVGMGTPKQEIWAQRTVDRLDCDVLWSVGALFDFVSGRVPRAPASLSDNGLEWIFRLAIEPKRMWRRYLVGNPVFLQPGDGAGPPAPRRAPLSAPRASRARLAGACSAPPSLALGLAHVRGRRRAAAASPRRCAWRRLRRAVRDRRLRPDAAAAARRAAPPRAAVGPAGRRGRRGARARAARLRVRPVRRRAGRSCSPAASRSASTPGGATRAAARALGAQAGVRVSWRHAARAARTSRC